MLVCKTDDPIGNLDSFYTICHLRKYSIEIRTGINGVEIYDNKTGIFAYGAR